MTPETQTTLLKELNTLITKVMYAETVKIPADIVMDKSEIVVFTVPIGDIADADGDKHRSLTVTSGYQFGDEPRNTGMTPDRALLSAHRLVTAAFAIIRQYGVVEGGEENDGKDLVK